MASADDKFQKVGMSTATTLSAPGYTIGNTSINVASTTNWPTDTGVTFAIDEVETVDGEEVRVAGTYNIFRGTVASGTQITNLTYVGGDANRNYSAGASTRVYILVSYAQTNRLIDGILTEHNQDGTHGAMTADSLTVDGATTLTGALTVKSYDGWISPTNTWTYVSATSFKITGTDVSSQFPVGTKIKLVQTTTKYFYVTACSFSTDTTVTVTGGSDYSLANATITSPALSYDVTPQGFPRWFSYAPTLSGSGGSPAIGNGTITGRFSMDGKTVFGNITLTNGSTTAFGSTNTTITFPVTASSSFPTRLPCGFFETLDASPAASYIGAVDANTTSTMRLSVLNASSTYIAYSSVSSTVPITPAVNDITRISFNYEAA